MIKFPGSITITLFGTVLSKKYATVDFITFASELITMSMNAEMTNALQYKILMSEVPKNEPARFFIMR